MERLGFLTAEEFLDHDPGRGHPERPHRLEAIWERLDRQGLLKECASLDFGEADPAWIRAVHPLSQLKRLEEFQKSAGISGENLWLDRDTACGPHSLRAARLACGAAIRGVEAVMTGDVRRAFCAVRPPGHHAEPDKAMGFCLLNNVAVAARYLVEKHGLERVLILDWDVHHGNGTQAAFYEDPAVYYVSIHQWGIYPGTGHPGEKGRGPGEGRNLNVLMESGDGDDEVVARLDATVAPEVERFRPEFILVSAGFDAHARDPLAGLEMSRAGFETLTRRVVAWAEQHASGRLVSLLEGGYNLEALAGSVEGHVGVLLAD